MCLIATTNIRIAKRSIICYKLLNRDWQGNLTSPYRYTSYEMGETKTVPYFTDLHDRKIRKRKKFTGINAGLHAFSTLQRARQSKLSYYVIAKCSIPKGTPYIRGTYNEIVALKLVVKDIIEH